MAQLPRKNQRAVWRNRRLLKPIWQVIPANYEHCVPVLSVPTREADMSVPDFLLFYLLFVIQL